tara:strand:- start:323 stop:805 length:483 start_codon:yes stop_codon:yes gene_type:complete
MHIDYIDDDICDFFIDKLRYYKSRPESEFCQRVRTMRGGFFGTVNLLPFADKKFYAHLNVIKKKVERVSSKSLMYHYLHMLDYDGGGDMLQHEHAHAEYYTSILYLNDCDDGETFFIIDGEREEVSPKKGKLVIYPSYIEHGANYSTSKKVLVSGYNINN